MYRADRRLTRRSCLMLLGLLSVPLFCGLNPLFGQIPAGWRIEDERLEKFFQLETAKVSNSSLADVKTLNDWRARREAYHLQLREMLGLAPWPEKTPLEATITGTHTRDGVIVETLHFQSQPGLYVTANLYRPEQQSRPLPAILYVCGHGRIKIGEISYGNKATYQHHGYWFAKNNYVCMIIDTIQLGEIEGLHHGTYREGMWWWHSRGYTPAGVEAWNGIRALDYLQSRPEVDGERLGITGRSGGGAYSWWVAALDERVKAAVPVAGITSMHNHIVDGCIEGHCDCMFMVNSYAWDFPQLAALIAPRALLISNTDKDRIFPLDGVVDVYNKTRRIYELHGALDKIGLNISEGPHKDTQELRINAFHWMNRFLKEEDPFIEIAAKKIFEPQELRVFDGIPSDEIVTSIQESFVPQAERKLPTDLAALPDFTRSIETQLRETAFRNAPTTEAKLIGEPVSQTSNGARLSLLHYRSDDVYDLPIYLLEREVAFENCNLRVIVCDAADWEAISADLATGFAKVPGLPSTKGDWSGTKTAQRLPKDGSAALAFVLPRGIGPTAWSGDDRKQTQIQRRFALLGHTLDSLRAFDVMQAVTAMKGDGKLHEAKITLTGSGAAADWTLLSALLGPAVEHVELHDLSTDFREGPQLLSAARFTTKPELVLLTTQRTQSLQIRPGNETQATFWQNFLKELHLALGDSLPLTIAEND